MDTYEVLKHDGKWYVIRRYPNTNAWYVVAGSFGAREIAEREARLRAKYERERIEART